MIVATTALSCGSCGVPQPIGTTLCSCGIDPRLTVEPCENCHGGAREIPGGCTQCDGQGNDETLECIGRFEDRKTLVAQGYRVPDDEIVQRLDNPAAEYLRRYGFSGHDGAVRKLILFEDEDGLDSNIVADLARQELDEREGAEMRAAAEHNARTAELLGEAIEALEERGLAEEWCAMARPFARFREAK